MDELKIFVLIRPENMLFYGEIYKSPPLGWGGWCHPTSPREAPFWKCVGFYIGIAQIASDPPPSVKQANVEKSCIECEAAFQLFQALNMRI